MNASKTTAPTALTLALCAPGKPTKKSVRNAIRYNFNSCSRLPDAGQRPF
jgi:hypothetical protein